MKSVYSILLCAVIGLVTSCSDNDSESVREKKDQLAVIVPQINSTANTLLLTNGKLAVPVSGLPDFNTFNPGNQLLLNYKSLDMHNGVENIEVTKFATANDSVFVSQFEPQQIFGFTYSGTFFIASSDSSEMYRGNASFAFSIKSIDGTSEYTYDILPDENPTSSDAVTGTGFFTVAKNTIVFYDNEDDTVLVPSGNFSYSVSGDLLFIWTVNEYGYISYSLQKE